MKRFYWVAFCWICKWRICIPAWLLQDELVEVVPYGCPECKHVVACWRYELD
jgi:hypothetical protein